MGEVEQFTNEVLKECPVTKQEFGISGNGEGIVWVDETVPDGKQNGTNLIDQQE